MPIEGKFYEGEELQLLLGVTKQAISNIAHRQGWKAIKRGLFCAESVEAYLVGRNIDPKYLSIRTHSHPAGATWAELEKEFDDASNAPEDAAAAQAAGVAFREEI